MGKQSNNKGKKRIPVFKSDADLWCAFEHADRSETKKNKLSEPDHKKKDKHGLPVLEDFSSVNGAVDEESAVAEEDDDFETLLEASFKEKQKGIKKALKKPVKMKKRLKRYPPPEIDLDLHGFTAIGAQLKTQSFLSGCKQQGYFSVRIIVGKGLHSNFGAVLPDVVEDVVKELKQQHIVLSYKWERKKKTQSGSMIVYIKQFDD